MADSLVTENDARARPGRRACCGEPGNAAADHENVAVRILVLVAIGIGRARGGAPCPPRDGSHARNATTLAVMPAT